MWYPFTLNCNGCPASSGYAPGDPRSTEPTAQNAYIGLNAATTVANNAAVPLNIVYNSSGTHISGTSPITLRVGHKYLVEYSVIGKPAAATDAMGAKLQLNGVDVAGSAAAAAAVVNAQSVSGGAIVSVTGANSTLTLVGISTTNALYSYASVRIIEVE